MATTRAGETITLAGHVPCGGVTCVMSTKRDKQGAGSITCYRGKLGQGKKFCFGKKSG